MNSVKKSFSIRDLENLSGIKAHTIRIWEKRYALLSPERTTTNIRSYSLESLQKLLNITLLYNHGYKISKIAKISSNNISKEASQIISNESVKHNAINAMKLAMINFDQTLFAKTYEQLLKEDTFSEIFKQIFMPFLNELGLLWQTNTISPAHEHFITSLIRQKIIANTEKIQSIEVTNTTKVFVPYLPENELHDIGLLFLNYQILLKGYKTIYLGQTIPVETLVDVLKYFNNVCFLSYFTVAPTQNKIEKYIQNFTDQMRGHDQAELWLLGYQTQYLKKDELAHFIKTFVSIEQIIEKL